MSAPQPSASFVDGPIYQAVQDYSDLFTADDVLVDRADAALAMAKVEAAVKAEIDAVVREAVDACTLAARINTDAIKHSMFSVLRALGLGDHVRPQSWSEVVSDEIVPAIEKLVGESAF